MFRLRPLFTIVSKIRGLHGSTTQIEGHKIHFEKVGTGKCRLILLPGALGSTRTDFDAQLSPGGLSHEHFTMLAWDPPGFGYSRPPERNLKENYYRNDSRIAAKLAERVFGKGTNYSILGWSDGGITGLIMASNDAIKVCDKLVIWGANAYVNDDDRKRVKSIIDTDNWSAKFRQRYENLYGAERLKELWKEFVTRSVEFDDICCPDLKNIKIPVLLLHGDKDPLVSDEHPSFISSNLSNCRVHRFPEGRHDIHIKYKEEFNKIVTSFLLTT